MSAYELLNLLNMLRKSNKMQGLISMISLFRNELNKLIIQEYECYTLFLT